MDLNYNQEETAFRGEVREFIRTHLPGDMSRKVLEHKRLGKEDYLRWQKILFEKGWIAAGWPVEHGGTGWSAIQRLYFRGRKRGGRRAPADSVRPAHGRSGDHRVRHRNSRSSTTCPASCPAKTGGARAIRNRARVPTSRRSRRAPSAKATITSSTARKPGIPTASGPICVSVWCAPPATARNRMASPSC